MSDRSDLLALCDTARKQLWEGVVVNIKVPLGSQWDDLPLFLTVEQAAAVVQVGRTSAYKLTEDWERTGVGLPFVRLGALKRVPREVLRDLLYARPQGPGIADENLQ